MTEDNESYSSIHSSVLSMGDFGRYVVESGIHHFSRYRIAQEYPDQRHREARRLASRSLLVYLPGRRAGFVV